MSKITSTSRLSFGYLMRKSKADLADMVEWMCDQKDAAYSERNQLVAALSKLFPSWIGWHEGDNDDWDPEWRNVIYILLPIGQVSWHIHESELVYFSHLQKKYGPHWDGHTTEEKYRRLAALESNNATPHPPQGTAGLG